MTSNIPKPPEGYDSWLQVYDAIQPEHRFIQDVTKNIVIRLPRKGKLIEFTELPLRDIIFYAFQELNQARLTQEEADELISSMSIDPFIQPEVKAEITRKLQTAARYD